MHSHMQKVGPLRGQFLVALTVEHLYVDLSFFVCPKGGEKHV